MCAALESIIGREILSEEFIYNWLESFYTIFNKTSFPDNYKLKMNQKSFLISLYFRFLEKNKDISENIYYILKEI